MGGRGAISGIQTVSSDRTFINKFSERLSSKEQKNAVSDKANFILRELEQDEAIQIIIRRSFRGGVPEVSISSGGLVKTGLTKSQAKGILSSIEAWINKFNREYKSIDNKEKSSAILSERQKARAEKSAIIQAQAQLRRAKKNIKKNYKIH